MRLKAPGAAEAARTLRWLGKTDWPHSPAYSSLDEGKQVGVHDVGMGGAHAMREILVDLESPLLQELYSQVGMVGDRHNQVVVAVHDERRHVDGLQILGEVRLGEGLDAVVVGLGTAHHGLPPPVLDDAWDRLR